MTDAVQADTSTSTEPNTFADYKAAKAAGTLTTATDKSVASGAQAAPAAKAAPSPETESTEPLTEKDLEGERSRVRSKMAKLLSQREDAKNETNTERTKREALEAELAELKRARPSVAVGQKPTLKAFLDSGQFKSWEDAHDAFLEARDAHNAKLADIAKSQEAHQTTAATFKTKYQESVAEFEAANPKVNYTESFTLVAGYLDGREDLTLSDAIVRSKNPAAIVHYLAQNEDVLEELTESPTKDALILLGEIRGRIPKSESTEALPQKQQDLPKAPRSVSARGAAPNSVRAMQQAADSDDFRAFKAAKHANQGN